MKNWLKIVLIIALGVSSFAYGFSVSAQISVYNIQIGDIKDGQAILKWTTNDYARSEVYYGLEATKLDKKLSYPAKKIHQANLYGLEENKNYYYQIILYSNDGEKTTLYPRSFSTKDMLDTQAPSFIDHQVIQTVGNAVAISWEASEKVAAEIQYYKKGDSTKKTTKKVGSYKKYHEYFVYNLDTYSEYYIKITIHDKAGNKKSATLHVNIYAQFNKASVINIKNIEPISSANNLVSTNQATIKFETNLPTKSYIKYGADPNRLTKKIQINEAQISTDHEVTIKELKPDTTYYYNISVYGSLYKKKAEVKGLSFITKKGAVLGIKDAANNPDDDNDKLSNSFEITIGTDPQDSDTDNDGYRDGTEVQNGYNPFGPGQWNKKIDFFYGQPRLDLKYEQSKATELKKAVDKKIPYIYISPSTWQMLINAYSYGDYPIDAIVMYIKLDGYTVHPDIDWHTWKNSPNYLKYAKYIK